MFLVVVMYFAMSCVLKCIFKMNLSSKKEIFCPILYNLSVAITQ